MNKNKKAISRLLSEFLLIIISLSIVSLAGIYLNIQSKILSLNPKIEIVEARAISWSGGTLIKINIANTGNVKLTINNINIKGISNYPLSITLEPSQIYEFEENIPSQPIGKKLTIIVSCIDQNGNTIEEIGNVEVMP
ncbi:MAG: hypothetical protein QW272_09120 [Candidatus Methanomethylicaceae archaeon]